MLLGFLDSIEVNDMDFAAPDTTSILDSKPRGALARGCDMARLRRPAAGGAKPQAFRLPAEAGAKRCRNTSRTVSLSPPKQLH